MFEVRHKVGVILENTSKEDVVEWCTNEEFVAYSTLVIWGTNLPDIVAMFKKEKVKEITHKHYTNKLSCVNIEAEKAGAWQIIDDPEIYAKLVE